MIGIELNQNCTELMTIGLKHGLLISVTSGNVIRIVPPLVINDDESDFLVAKLTLLIKEFIESK